MSLLENPIVGGINAVGGLVNSIFGNKAARETNIHDEQMSAYDEVAAEASAQIRENRNWWDSFIDGLNRLPRPIMAFMVIGAMLWCPINPQKFAIVMDAYRLVPNWLSLVFAQIIALYCGGRMLDKWNMAPVADATVKSVLSDITPKTNIKTQYSLPQSKIEPLSSAKNETDEVYKKDMADTSKPLSLDSIVKWNNLHAQTK